MYEEIMGANVQTSRHINVRIVERERVRHQFPRFRRDAKLDPVLKRSILLWVIYKFPVIYKPSRGEKEQLKQIRTTEGIQEAESEKWLNDLLVIFNKEQDCWGLWKLRKVHTQDVSCRLRD